MSWKSTLKKAAAQQEFCRPAFTTEKIDWARVVTVDFETYFGVEYTLKKMSTSEYIRDDRFKAQMVGIKIGKGKTKVYGPKQIARALKAINWQTHSLLAHNCVPGDTEVLTRSGWKQIKDVPQTAEIMQWDPTTQALSWCVPLAKIKNKAKELVSWGSSFHRGQYTAGHRMYFQTPDKAEWQVDTAENVAKRSMNNTYIPLSGYYAGSTDGALTEAEARLMEAIRADGSWRITDGAFYGVQFNIRKDRKAARLRELCVAVGVDLSEPDARGRMHIRRTQAPVLAKLFELLGLNKTYGCWLIEQPLAIRQAVLEELIFWDGHETGKKGFQWSTASYMTATTIETVAHVSGWRVSGTWRDNARGFNAKNPGASLFVATVTQASRAKLVNKPTVKKHSGAVYCFTVPTGAFLMRAGGRICVTGNCAFDGLILSHHYGIIPARYYDTLSMARGLHSNEVGGSLDDVAKFYDGEGKIDGVLDKTKGVFDWPKALYDEAAVYCAQDVDETFRIFQAMHAKYPVDELDLIHMTIRMFCDPVLKVDIPRVEAEYAREVERREKLFFGVIDPTRYDIGGDLWEKELHKKLIKGPAERELEGIDRGMHIIKRLLGNNEFFVSLLAAEDIEAPKKISKAWMALSKDEQEERLDDKYSYAFAKDDSEFIGLPDNIDAWRGKLDPNKKKDVAAISAKQDRIRALVDARLAVKSTTNITRAERFLKAGEDGMPLPVGYSYYRAHTGRWGGNNKMNMQNLTRGGELRLSILAPTGYQMAVCDSGQIEARVNGWLWGQKDLMDAFRKADTWDKAKGVARGDDRDAYCQFGDAVYGREITTDDKMERFVGKVCVAGDQLVLTRRGLVPMCLISKEDWLWDGVEWVRHDGLIDQGIQEVITYDGLTATPDHEVFTEDGRVIPLRQAASEMVRLQSTGIEGQAVRFCDDHVIADTPRKRLSVRIGKVQSFGGDETNVLEQLEERQDNVVPQERSQTGRECGGTRPTVRRDSGQMQQPGEQAVAELRRTRDQMPVQDAHGVHPVGLEEFATRGLRRCGDRQNGQRRELRAGESEAGHAHTTGAQQAEHEDGELARNESSAGGIPEPIFPILDLDSSGPGNDWRRNTRKVRVYDIANAGPRLRYTVAGKLVFNCVLGLGFQMGAPKFQMTLAKGALGGPPVYFELSECHRIVNTYRNRNYKIRDGWGICTGIIEDMAEGREGSYKCLNWEKGVLWLPNGMSLKYPDLRKRIGDKGWDEWTYQSGDMRSKIYGGLLCENIVQALARIIVASQMLAIDRKYRVVMTTHDEAVALPKTREAQKCFDYMTLCFRTAPAWCPDIPLNSEGGFANNYSK